MKQPCYSQIFFLLSLFLFGCCLVPDFALGAQDLTVNWQHLDSKDEDNEDNYWLNYTLNLNQEVTEVISLQESIRYTSKWAQKSDSEGLHPALQFGLLSDIFALDIFYYATEQRNSDQGNTSRRNGEVSWRSTWDKPLWPVLRASIGLDAMDDDETPHLAKTDEETHSAGVDWDLDIFSLYYNYQWQERHDFVQQSQRESTNQFGRVEASQNFWQNRLMIGFSQQYTESFEDSVYKVGAGGIVPIQHVLSQVLHGLDNTPVNTLPGDLTSAPLLHDGDLATTSGIFTNGIDSPPHNFALRVDYNQIDRVYMYTVDDESSQAAAFVFALYGSNNGTDWLPLAGTVPFTYNATEQRFELDTSGYAQQLWLKVVITNSSLQQVDFSEIEIFELMTSSDDRLALSSKSTSAITDFNFSARLSQRSTLSYSLNYNRGGYSSGNDFRHFNQVGELKWLADAISLSASISEARDQDGDRSETLKRSYNASLGLSPLNSVTMNFGLGRTDKFEGTQRHSVEQEISFYTTLMPYPDLDATCDLLYHDTAYDAGGQNLRDYSGNIIVSARLLPTLNADWKTDYRYLKGALGYENYGSDLIINWRPSDTLSLMTTGKSHWQDGVSTSDGVMMRATLSPVAAIQVSLGYDYDHSSEVTNKYSAYASWALGSYFTLQGNGDYTTRPTENDWQVSIQLTGRFTSQ